MVADKGEGRDGRVEKIKSIIELIVCLRNNGLILSHGDKVKRTEMMEEYLNKDDLSESGVPPNVI